MLPEGRNSQTSSNHMWQSMGAHGVASPYFDITAFAPVTTARFGSSSFDSVRGQGYGNFDFGLFRTFQVGDTKAQFRMEALNLTNHPNFSNPDNGVTDSDFGLITSINPGIRHRGTLLPSRPKTYVLGCAMIRVNGRLQTMVSQKFLHCSRHKPANYDTDWSTTALNNGT